MQPRLLLLLFSQCFNITNWKHSYFISRKHHAWSNTHTHTHNSISLPRMAQLGWALLFLLGSWSSVEEGLPLPRAGSLPWENLPWVPPLPRAEVAEVLQGSPPSVRDVLHSGPPINIHQGSQRSQGGQDDKREAYRSKGKGEQEPEVSIHIIQGVF